MPKDERHDGKRQFSSRLPSSACTSRACSTGALAAASFPRYFRTLTCTWRHPRSELFGADRRQRPRACAPTAAVPIVDLH